MTISSTATDDNGPHRTGPRVWPELAEPGTPLTPARPAQMRDPRRPVWRDDQGRVHVHGFRDVEALMRSDLTSVDASALPEFDPETAHITLLFVWATDHHVRPDGTPGRHDAQRTLLLPWLGARSVAGRRARLAEITRRAAEALPERFDAYHDYATRVAVSAVAEVVGLTIDEVSWLLDRQREHPPMDQGGYPQQPHQPEVDSFFRQLFARDRLEGMTRAMHEAWQRGEVAEREAHAMVWGAIQASTLNVGATTTATTGLLVEHGSWPPALQRVPGAVEEAIRLVAPFPVGVRYPIAELTLPSRAVVRAGEMVVLHIDAAGRDPEGGYDTSRAGLDAFDPRRDPNPHLGWAVGRHRCIGVALARAIIHTSIVALAEACPQLRLDGPWRRYRGIEDGYDSAPLLHLR